MVGLVGSPQVVQCEQGQKDSREARHCQKHLGQGNLIGGGHPHRNCQNQEPDSCKNSKEGNPPNDTPVFLPSSLEFPRVNETALPFFTVIGAQLPIVERPVHVHVNGGSQTVAGHQHNQHKNDSINKPIQFSSLFHMLLPHQ